MIAFQANCHKVKVKHPSTKKKKILTQKKYFEWKAVLSINGHIAYLLFLFDSIFFLI